MDKCIILGKEYIMLPYGIGGRPTYITEDDLKDELELLKFRMNIAKNRRKEMND